MVDGIDTVKFAYVQFVGESVKPMAKAKVSTHKGALEKQFKVGSIIFGCMFYIWDAFSIFLDACSIFGMHFLYFGMRVLYLGCIFYIFGFMFYHLGCIFYIWSGYG